MSRTAYHQAYYQAHKEARNDKPPCGGLTRAGGWPYSRDACRGVVTIDRGNRSVNHPPLSSGISGRGNYAQSALNPHRGRQPVGAQRQSGSANVTGKPEK